jgi:hypothetical protein
MASDGRRTNTASRSSGVGAKWETFEELSDLFIETNKERRFHFCSDDCEQLTVVNYFNFLRCEWLQMHGPGVGL